MPKSHNSNFIANIYMFFFLTRRVKVTTKLTLYFTYIFGDFAGGPVAKMPSSQCRGPGFYP